jgi:L-2-hydroxyglutarate oxidase
VTKYDIAIIGSGILGTSISYWLSSLYDIHVCVIDKESEVGMHASSRNTGIVHSPFYLDPQKKEVLAKSAFLSYDLWKTLAEQRKLQWKKVGTLEVAIDESQHKTLEKYMKWGVDNGISQNDLELLDADQVTKKEPNVMCYSAIFCNRDAVVDYGSFTRQLKKESEKNGSTFLLNHEVSSIEGGPTINFKNSPNITANLIINCAGGNSLDVAKMFGLAQEYSDLHFRGEYWIAQKDYTNLARTNIYSVAKFKDFPFLDPHWILRIDGRSEVGPNAVPVPSPETYSGYIGDPETLISKLSEIITGNAKKLLSNPDFISLISKEWLSSISKTVMIDRVKQFIPKIKSSFFSERGTTGIRTPIITPNGEFQPDVMELGNEVSFHILNYNSPGATGAPAYSAYVVKKLKNGGFLDYKERKKDTIWNFEKIMSQT